MNGWLTVVVTVVVAVLGGGGAAAIINAFARRKVTDVEVTKGLNESALEFANELKKDAQDARKETAEARREMGEMRREMSAVRVEAEALARDLRHLRLAILDPFATLEQLRAMVGGGPGSNGVAPRVPSTPV